MRADHGHVRVSCPHLVVIALIIFFPCCRQLPFCLTPFTASKRGLSRQREESRGDERSHTPPTRLSHVEEAVVTDGNEHCPESSGDGWQEYKKGMHVVLVS